MLFLGISPSILCSRNGHPLFRLVSDSPVTRDDDYVHSFSLGARPMRKKGLPSRGTFRSQPARARSAVIPAERQGFISNTYRPADWLVHCS